MERRSLAVVSGVLAVMLLAVPVSAQTAAEVSPVCAGRTGAVTVTAGMRILPAVLEVELFVENRGAGDIRFEPSQASLRTTGGVVSPWTADQTKRAHRDYSTYALAGLLIGPLGLLVTGASQLNFTQYVDSRTFHAVDVAAGGSVRGSLFFPLPDKLGTRAVLELGGLRARLYCTLPRAPRTDGAGAPETRERVGSRGEGESTAVAPDVAAARPAPLAVPPLTVTLLARGSSGPAEVTVTAVEFDAAYTAVEMTVTNRAPADADVFAALANAVLTSSGAAHAVRMAQSEFTDRVAAEKSAAVRLVFDPLPQPPQTPSATLKVPGIRYGMDTVDVEVELRF